MTTLTTSNTSKPARRTSSGVRLFDAQLLGYLALLHAVKCGYGSNRFCWKYGKLTLSYLTNTRESTI